MQDAGSAQGGYHRCVMTCCRATLALALAPISSACSRTPARGVDEPLTIRPLDLAVGSGSALPQLSASGDRAIVSWVETVAAEGGTRATLKFAERSSGAWSAPKTVASGTDWFVNSADVPSVVRLDAQTLAAHWLQTTDAHLEAYDLRIAWSKDDGATWTPSVTPHHDGTKTQ